jgi:hypothetical protein
MREQVLVKHDPYQPIDPVEASNRIHKEDIPSTATAKRLQHHIWYPGGDLPPGYLVRVGKQRTVSSTTGVLHLDKPAEGASTITVQGVESKFVEPLVIRKGVYSVQPRFVSLQKWEGVVLEVLDDSFLARLVDLTNGGSDEEAEFALEEVTPEDRVLVEPGAVFYWNIGYNDSISGQRTRVSEIRFRRLPAWQPEELKEAKRIVSILKDLIGWK